MVMVQRVDGNTSKFHGAYAGPLDEVIKFFKRVDPTSKVFLSETHETWVVVGGELHKFIPTQFVNIYLDPEGVSKTRESMGIREPVEV